MTNATLIAGNEVNTGIRSLKRYVQKGDFESLDAALGEGTQQWTPDRTRKIIQDLWIQNQEIYTDLKHQTFRDVFGPDVHSIGASAFYGRTISNGDGTELTARLSSEEMLEGHQEASKRTEDQYEISQVLTKYG